MITITYPNVSIKGVVVSFNVSKVSRFGAVVGVLKGVTTTVSNLKQLIQFWS